MKDFFLKEKTKIKKIIILGFLFFISAFLSFQLVSAQGTAIGPRYKIEDSYVEVQKGLGLQEIVLTRKEKGEENISGKFKIIDDYLVSNIPENEFLEKYSFLKNGFKDLKIEIEIDQPFFKKEKFYQPKSLFQKMESLFFGEKLPDYRLTKEVSDTDEALETNFGTPDLSLKTVYKEEEGKIKQSLFLNNSSDKGINFQLSFIHSIEADQVSFGGNEYKISESPQLLSPEKGSSVSFKINNLSGQRFKYDFSDLKNFNPEVWIFKKDSQNFLLVKISLSIPVNSSVIIDPVYTVDSTTASLGTAWGFQRKTWHDGARFWTSFWSDADDRIEFWYSDDGQSWTENDGAQVSLDSNDFSLLCDATYCFLVYAQGNYVYAQAANNYPGTGFGWDPPVEIYLDKENLYYYVHLSRSANGYLFVTYEEVGALYYTLYVQKSISANDVSNWEAATQLDTGISGEIYGLTVQMRSGDDSMLAIWHQGTAIESATSDDAGSRWGTATTVDSSVNSGLADNISAIYDDSEYDVHLLYNDSGAGGDNVINYKRWDSSSGAWRTSVVLASSTYSGINDYVSISVDRDTEYLYAFWINISADDPIVYSVFYREGAFDYVSRWEPAQTLASSSNALTWITSNDFPYTDTANNIFAEWLETNSIVYDVKFGILAAANATPTVGTVILNGGNNINLTENTTTTISATATVTDTNGYSDITSVIGKIYRSGVGTNCSDNDNNCYSDSICATSSCSGNSCTATCQADLWFHANPTDASSTLGPTYEWRAWIKATDQSNASSSGISVGVDVMTLYALDLSYLYERYNAGDDSAYAAGGTTWQSQTFTVGNTGASSSHNIINVKLKLGRFGSPGTSTLSIKAVDSNGAPTSTDLTSVNFDGNALNVSAEWRIFSLPSYQLSSNTKYALVLRAPYGNVLVSAVTWSYDGSSPTYSGGSCYVSDNSGSRWSADTNKDFIFEEYGSGGINYGTLSPGANTGSSHEQNNVLNTGNAAIDIYLYGTDLEKQ